MRGIISKRNNRRNSETEGGGEREREGGRNRNRRAINFQDRIKLAIMSLKC